MKKNILSLCVLLTGCFSYAQTFTASFTGASAAIPGTSTMQTCFPLTVNGVGSINGAVLGLKEICLNIIHPNVDELEIVLRAPDGTVVPLSMQNGGSGDNYTGTCFTATATQSIKFGTAPFAGSYSPEGHLGAVNNGQNADGNWNLCIQDRRTGANAGSLSSYSLNFGSSPAPLPPVLPGCSYTLPGTSSCANATTICDFNGLCGTTSGTTVQNWTGSGLNGCFGLENNSFVKFTASGATASFSVWVPTHSIAGNYNLGGIQMLFFSGSCGTGAVTTYGCYPHILPYSSAGSPIISVVTASGLTPGNVYYLMIDGFNSDHCTFTIEAISGVSILNVTPSAASICQGESVNLTASGANNIFSWSPAATLSASTGSMVTATPASTTTYTVASTGIGSCAITKNVIVTVNQLPVLTTQPAAATQNVCVNGPTTSLTVVAAAGSGTISSYQWYSNTIAANTGGTLIPGANAASYSPLSTAVGTLYYYCLITNSNNCNVLSVSSGPVVISGTLAALTASATAQPTCSLPTGTITITVPTGASIQYSIGGAFQASNIFTGLLPNTYNITAQNTATGCSTLSIAITINTVPPGVATPSASVTVQPTCSAPGGTIVVTAPTGPNLQYSIGGAYQPGATFTGLSPSTYNVTVKDNSTGCISPALPITVNPPPGAPATPTATATQQPTCLAPTGIILVTAPTGAGIQYSIGGAYQTSGSFTGLLPNTYNVTVKDNVTGCISAVLPVIINAVTGAPAAPAATVTVQPTCIVPTGTIVITAPASPDIQYSIGGIYQLSGVFANLVPNIYNVTARDIITGCISAILQLTVNPVPLPPMIPTATVTVQPTCAIPSGTILITAPAGPDLQYSIGGIYQTGSSFTGLVPGTYNVTATNTVTGCTSSTIPVIVNVVPGAPPAPTAGVTVQPTCANPTGVLVITAPTGANIQYSIGGSYQNSNTFTGLVPGSYPVSVKEIVTGCVSPATLIVIAPVPGLPAPPVTTSGSRCGDGIVTLTAGGTGVFTWYSNAALTNQVATGTNFSPSVASTTTYYITATNNNCASTASTATATVNLLPSPDLGSNRSVCEGDRTILNPGTFSSYLWQDNSTLPRFTVSFSGLYTVTVTDALGCVNSAAVSIAILEDCNDIYFPSAFTPNGDTKNDEFGPLPLSSLTLVTNYNLVIYNRYGQKVFQGYDPYQRWSGKFLNKINVGSYTWVATYRFRGNEKVSRGNIVILR